MALSAEDLAEIAKLIEASKSDAAKVAEEQSKRLLKAMDDKVAKAVAAIPKPEPPPDPPLDPPKPGDPPGDSPELKRIQAEMEKLRRQAEDQQKRAEAAEAARQTEALRTGVRDALVAAGADAKRVHLALSHFEATKAVRLNDAGVPCFVVTDQYGEQIVPAAEHAKKWLETDEGKFFLPPTGTQGTGDKAGDAARRTGSVVSEADLERSLLALF